MQKIMQSLHGTVLALPDDTTVVPGHGPLTTIGDERESNPFLVKGITSNTVPLQGADRLRQLLS